MKLHYTIGEIAKLYNITTDTLRHYEKEGLLIPERALNGYRIYTLFDIWKLNVITTMKRLDISLKEIKQFLEERSVEKEKAILNQELQFIEEQINSLEKQRHYINHRIFALEDAQTNDLINQVRFIDYSERKIIHLEEKIETDNEVDLAFHQLMQQSKETIQIYNRDFAVLLPIEKIHQRKYNEYSDAILIVGEGQPYDRTLPQGTYATLRYQGSYQNAEKAYNQLLSRIKSLGYHPGSYAIERYLIDINQTSNINEYVTELQVIVE